MTRFLTWMQCCTKYTTATECKDAFLFYVVRPYFPSLCFLYLVHSFLPNQNHLRATLNRGWIALPVPTKKNALHKRENVLMFEQSSIKTKILNYSIFPSYPSAFSIFAVARVQNHADGDSESGDSYNNDQIRVLGFLNMWIRF